MARIKTSSGWFYYKSKILFLGIKQINKTIAFDNLRDLLPIIESAGIQTGPVFGTLLGIIRENDFITWDEDVDFYILKEDELLFRDLLPVFKKNGYDLVRYERRGLYSLMRNGEYIDFYVMRSVSDEVLHTGGADFLFKSFFTDTIKKDFKGLQLTIPKEYERHLEFLYGDWRTPVKYADFNLSLSKRWLLKAKHYIKGKLPDSLYFYLLKHHHKKDLIKFEGKCKRKGIVLNSKICL